MEIAIKNLRDKSMSRLTVYKHLNLILDSPQKNINKTDVDTLFAIFQCDLLQGTQNGVNSLILNSIKLIVDEIKDDVTYSDSLKDIMTTLLKHLIAIVRFPQAQGNHKICWEMISYLSDSNLKSVMDSNAKQMSPFISQSLNGTIDKTIKIVIAKVLLRWLKMSTEEELPTIVADCQNCWFGYTFPSMFLPDENLRPVHVETMELILPYLRNVDYINNPKWMAIMLELQKKRYTPILLQLFQSKNIVWRSIWCIMLRLLEKDLKKNGLLINSLLPILEHAFRDETTRKDAFYCWKVLIEVSTSQKNEPNNPKIVKLLYTPLISNNAKSADMAIVKFDVWWTLLTKISNDLSSKMNDLLYPFINYCFGDSNKNESLIPGLVFPSLQPYTVKSLVELFGHETSCKGCVGDIILHLKQPVMNNLIFDSANKRWLDVVRTAIVLISDQMMNATENEQTINNMRQNVKCIWTSLLKIVTNIVNPNLKIITFENMLTMFYSMCEENKPNIILWELILDYLIPSMVAKDTGYSEEFLTDSSNYKNNENISPIRALMLFYISSKVQACTIPELNVVVFKDFVRIELDHSIADVCSWIMFYLKSTEPSVSIWCAVSSALTDSKYSNINDIYSRILMWPLDMDFDYREVSKVTHYWRGLYTFITQKILIPKNKKLENFDEQLIRKIEKASQTMVESKVVMCSYFISSIIKNRIKCNPVIQVTFLPPLLKLIQELLCQTRKYNMMDYVMDAVIEIVDCTSCVLASYSSRRSTPEYLQLLTKTAELSLKSTHVCLQKTLLSTKLPTYSEKLAELFPSFLLTAFSSACCQTISDIIYTLARKNEECVAHFKDVLQTVYKCQSLSSTAGKKLDKIMKDNCDFKSPQQKIDSKGKAGKNDAIVTNGDDFVVIKPNWKFDPKKLTEHQKEILTRRRENIPALYEDLSQSQDDYNMKGWKPAGYTNDETSESSKEHDGSRDKSSSRDITARKEISKSTVNPDDEQNGSKNDSANESINDSIAKKVLRDIPNPILVDTINNSLLQNGDGKTHKSQKEKINENVENDNMKLNIVASPIVIKGSFQSRLERSIKKLQEVSVKLADRKTAPALDEMNTGSPVRIIKVVQLSPKPGFNVTPKSKSLNVNTSTPVSASKKSKGIKNPVNQSENVTSTRPNCDKSNDTIGPHCDKTNDISRPNCDKSNETARPSCDKSNDTARSNCDKPYETSRPNCDISKNVAKPNCDVSSDAARPHFDISNDTARPICDISNESVVPNSDKEVEENRVTTPVTKNVANSKVDITPTSNHDNISLKLNITPTTDSLHKLPESERPIRKRKRPSKFDPDDLRFIGKRRASTSLIDNLRGSYSSDIDDSSESSSVCSEVSSSQKDDDTTPTKIKKRKLRLLKALEIDTVDGHPSKNMFDYDKPICRRSMTIGNNEPEIKRRRISISSEPKLKQKKTVNDKFKKKIQEVIDLQSSDDTVQSDMALSQSGDINSSKEMQESPCEIITVTQSEPIAVDDEILKPVNESVIIVEPTETLVEDAVIVKTNKSTSITSDDVISQTLKKQAEESTVLEVSDQSVIEILTNDEVDVTNNDLSKSADLIQSPEKTDVEIVNSPVIEVDDDDDDKMDLVCNENTDLPESEDVIQSSQESDSNISMTQKRLSKIFNRKSRSPKITSHGNETITNHIVILDTQLDNVNTAEMDTLPVSNVSLSEKAVADKSTEAIQPTASTTIEIAEADTEMLDVETQLPEEMKYDVMEETKTVENKTTEEKIIIGTVAAGDMDLNDNKFEAENVIDIFESKSNCSDDEDPTNRSTILSSPYRDDIDDKNTELLNSTLDISPIKSVEHLAENYELESLGCKVLSDESSDTDQANSPCNSKNSSPVKLKEDCTTVSSPASDKTIPPDNVSPPRGIYSPTSSMSQKRNRPLVSRIGGRTAQMLGMCQRGFDGSDNKFSNVTSLSPVRMIARKNLHSFYGSAVSNDVADGNSEDENMLEFTKSLPSPYASPSMPILKKLQEDQTLSPSGKKKRVSFHDPPVSKQLSIEKYIDPPQLVRSPQRVKVIKNYKDEPASFMKQPKVVYCLAKKIESVEQSISPPKEIQHSESNLSEMCSLDAESQQPIDLVNNCLLDDTQPIYPSLSDCRISISEIASNLTSESCKNMFLQEIGDSICTIGDLANLTELKVNRLPVSFPKIQTVKRVLSEYENTLQQLTETLIETQSQTNDSNNINDNVHSELECDENIQESPLGVNQAIVSSEQMEIDTTECHIDEEIIVKQSPSPLKSSEPLDKSSNCIDEVKESTEVKTSDDSKDYKYVNMNHTIEVMRDDDKISMFKELLKHEAVSDYLVKNIHDFITISTNIQAKK